MAATRVDQWLWAIRLYKTRTQATDACRGGHVKINGSSAKAAAPVKVGDRVATHLHGRDRVVEVVRPIDKRVGAAVAAECYIDQSPPPPSPDLDPMSFLRDRAAGRPTKRDRRELDRLRRSR